MSSNQEIIQKAVTRFQSGFNCTQSVLSTLYEYMTPEGKTELIPKIASGFGGGIGLRGSVCGALIGSIMAVGIKCGSNTKGEENNFKAYAYSQALYDMFERAHGTVICRELIKFDLSKPEQVAKAKQDGVFANLCTKLVETAMKNYLQIENK